MKVFVYGASGLTGRGVADELTKAGHQVVGGSRHPEKLPGGTNLRYVAVDATRPELGLDALNEVDAVTLLSPPGFTNQFEILSPWIARAKERGLKKVVLMTAMGVEFAPPEAPFRKLELFLEDSGLNFTIVRPNWFMQNFNTFWIAGILKDRKIYFPGGEAQASFIDARDISAVIARIVGGDGYKAQALNLTGGAAITHTDAARFISAATGLDIQYVDMAPEAFVSGLIAAGLSADYANFLGYIAGALREGHASAVLDSVQKVLGRAPISFETYARDHKQAWLS